jgi:hypothetical protein
LTAASFSAAPVKVRFFPAIDGRSKNRKLTHAAPKEAVPDIDGGSLGVTICAA